MSKLDSKTSNGGDSAKGSNRLRPKKARPSGGLAQKNNIIEESVLNDKSVQDVNLGAQTWGFAECEPKYNKEGRLPAGDLRTEVE